MLTNEEGDKGLWAAEVNPIRARVSAESEGWNAVRAVRTADAGGLGAAVAV